MGHAECVKVLSEAAAAADGRAGADGASSGAAAAAVDAPLLGQRVELSGLSARPKLNGQRGVAQSFEGGRYAVALEGGGESVRVRPERLRPVEAAEQASSGGVAISEAVVQAVKRGNEEAVLAWLDSGGRADATYEKGKASGLTLLMCAAFYGHERVVELLLRHGAEINQQSSNGGTALIDAAFHGHERVVDLLIRGGAEINLQDSYGRTALMTAAFFNHPAVVRRLLRAGADTAARSANGMTALQWAKEKAPRRVRRGLQAARQGVGCGGTACGDGSRRRRRRRRSLGWIESRKDAISSGGGGAGVERWRGSFRRGHRSG